MPAERDLPEGRLEVRAEALRREINARGHRRARNRAVAILVPLVLALVATPALAYHDRLLNLFDSGQQISQQSLDDADSAMLEHAVGANGRAVEIASDGNLAFYVLTNDAGLYCLTPGSPAGPTRFDATGRCTTSIDELLPSADRPLVLSSYVLIDPATGVVVRGGLTGIALDAVTRVATVDATGNEIQSVAVSDHIFAFPWQLSGEPIALVAKDGQGDALGSVSLKANLPPALPAP